MDESFLAILRKQSKHIKSLQYQVFQLKKEIRQLRNNREWTAVELANYDWQDIKEPTYESNFLR